MGNSCYASLNSSRLEFFALLCEKRGSFACRDCHWCSDESDTILEFRFRCASSGLAVVIHYDPYTLKFLPVLSDAPRNILENPKSWISLAIRSHSRFTLSDRTPECL